MNILVIRTHRLGDILQLTPMLKGLKEEYPESKISFVIGKGFAELLERNPDVDEIISIPENEYRYWLKNSPEKYSSIFNEIYDLVYELKRKDFKIVINRQYEWGAMLARLVGAETVLGGSYSQEKGLYFEDRASRDLFHLVRNDRKANRRNLVDWSCRIAGVCPGPRRKMIFCVSKIARQEAERLLGDHAVKYKESMVAVQMGAARSFRQWGVENFTEIIHWLLKEKEKRVVLIGSEDEKDLGEQLEQTLGAQEPKLINLIGKTSLRMLGAVLEKCEFLIAGDTGPMHMASAVGTPVLALFFGTAYPWETGPYGPGHLVIYSDVPCAPCLDPEACQNAHRCKREIKSDAVIKALEAAEAFWKNEPVHWEAGTDSVKLFVTGRGKEDEQILVSLDSEGSVPERVAQRISAKREMSLAGPKVILEKGDEVIRLFLAGEADNGFLSFDQYLGYWLEAKDLIMREQPGMEERFSELLKECLGAMQSKDLVTLMDAIEYGFKPLLERSLIPGHDMEIGSGNSQGFSEPELPS